MLPEKREETQYPQAVGQEESRDWADRIREFFIKFQLAWRLFWDERVPLTTKIIPLAMVFYLLLPVDLVPDVILGLGQADDLVLLLAGLQLFISLSPGGLVDEHRRLLQHPDENHDWIPTEGPIIDLEAEDVGNADVAEGEASQ